MARPTRAPVPDFGPALAVGAGLASRPGSTCAVCRSVRRAIARSPSADRAISFGSPCSGQVVNGQVGEADLLDLEQEDVRADLDQAHQPAGRFESDGQVGVADAVWIRGADRQIPLAGL